MKCLTDRQTEIDCLKGIGIVLVLIGHFIEPYRKLTPVFNSIFLMIYSFHMPLFCFISGYVAKFNMKKLLGQMEVLYIKASIFYYFFRVIVLSEALSIRGIVKNIVCPWWHLWYLDALVFWGICLYVVDKNRDRSRLFMITVSLVLSLFAGYLEIPFLRSRVIVFFPFYLVGYLYKNEIKIFLEKCKLKYKRWNMLGWMALGINGILICLYNDKINAESFFNWQSYQSGGYMIQNRLLYIIGAFVILGAILLIIKNIEFKFFINLGKRTLYIYISCNGILVF